MALRNALEQTFGSYVSSRTEIFNDELVVDEIVSVASGNVKNFKVIDKSQLPNNYWSVTVDAVVSVDKLTSFAKGKGMEVKVEGALFAANVKQKELNKKAEVKVIYTMFSVVNEIFETAWDYSLETGQPSKNIMVGRGRRALSECPVARRLNPSRSEFHQWRYYPCIIYGPVFSMELRPLPT